MGGRTIGTVIGILLLASGWILSVLWFSDPFTPIPLVLGLSGFLILFLSLPAPKSAERL